MSVYIVPPAMREVHWLQSDRHTNAWEIARITLPLGTKGIEVNTGKQFYLDSLRQWVEWEERKAEEAALSERGETLEEVLVVLKQIRFMIAECSGIEPDEL